MQNLQLLMETIERNKTKRLNLPRCRIDDEKLEYMISAFWDGQLSSLESMVLSDKTITRN